MNLWLELLFVLARAALVSLGTVMAHHGWISEGAASRLSGEAAVWVATGLFVIGIAIGQSAWSKVKIAAAARLALMFPAGSPAGLVATALREVTRAAMWNLARSMTDEDRVKLREAAGTVRRVLVENGYCDPLDDQRAEEKAQ